MGNYDLSIFEDKTALINISLPERKEEKTRLEDVFEINGTKHEAAVPLNCEYTPISKDFQKFTAKDYLFELDIFQKISLASLERDEPILVAAHTSSGKTVVAEYAIAMSLRDNQRVVYTSPIKALSNQKYRELLTEFEDVGIMTGDVTINPTASCLVMTTEILRNMLYNGSEVIREVHWIIFDEIHYLKDRNRGVVWEETIILLPKHVRMVFLSATIPNALEFAEWISYIQNQVVHVVYTEKRITPLVHYFRTDKLYLIKDTEFHSNNFSSAIKNIRKGGGRVVFKDISEAINDVDLPVVVFSFRRRDCEVFATKLYQDYLNESEKEVVRTIYTNAIGSLRKEDREIPIIENVLPLLLKGIGIHHSGLLPILKEIVEILFQEGYIKVLFATETFSIGLNMPAKSVIFTSLKKYDGVNNRTLTSAEYIQMSGRAGRRGIDKHGIVVSIITEPLSIKEAKDLFSCAKDRLVSAFRLTYNMILNLMRVEGIDPLYLISRSFHNFQMYKDAQTKENYLYHIYNQIKDVPSNRLSNLLIEREQKRLERAEALSKHLSNNFKTGRVIDFIIPRFGSSITISNGIIEKVHPDKLDVSVYTNKGIRNVEIDSNWVENIYDIRVKPSTKAFKTKFNKIEFKYDDTNINEIEEEIKKVDGSIDFRFCIFCHKPFHSCLTSCGSRFLKDQLENQNCIDQEQNSDSFVREEQGSTELIVAREFLMNEDLKYVFGAVYKQISKLREVYHMEECKRRIQVLKHLEYCDDNGILTKGRIACEISSADELVLTEIMLNGEFIKMEIEDIAPLLSCCVFDEWDSDVKDIAPRDKELYSIIETSVKKICEVLKLCSIDVKPENYIRGFSWQLMDVVRMWVNGSTFIEICMKTDVFEGSIIRTFKGLKRYLSNYPMLPE